MLQGDEGNQDPGGAPPLYVQKGPVLDNTAHGSPLPEPATVSFLAPHLPELGPCVCVGGGGAQAYLGFS